MRVRLPIADAPRPDVPLEADGQRPRVKAIVLAIVPVGGLDAAATFAEHLLRALRVGGRAPEAWIVERAAEGQSSSWRGLEGPLASRLHEAGAAAVRLVEVALSDAAVLRKRLLESEGEPLVVVGADVPVVVEPTLTLALTAGRSPTTWSATARASRPFWDGELVEVRSELARGIASAVLGRIPAR